MNREEALGIVAEARKRGDTPDLRGADLRGADLNWADLCEADLSGANLRGADLSGDDLSAANLSGADLSAANLSAADLCWAKGILALGPGGSRGDMLYAVAHDGGPRVLAGCFWGTVAEFRDAVLETHSDNNHAAYYTACIAMIEVWWKAYEEVRE